MKPGMSTPVSDAGQAAVETALTMPLLLFMVLGALQLFLLVQAKLMAQYAVFQAARVGSVNHGSCDVMTHAALLVLTPTVRSFMGPTLSGTPGERLATAFRQIRLNNYGDTHGWSSSEAVLWLVRESPRFPRDNLALAREEFDNPLRAGGTPVRLELRMIFWAPMVVPFANWVINRAQLAHLGLQPYLAQNPLLPTQTARWGATGPFRLQPEVAQEYLFRSALTHYVFPIEVTATMRMMTQVKASAFATNNCAQAPESL